MMNPQKQITTNAPSIRYEGDLRAEQAGIMQKHAQAMQQMQQQNMMQQQQQQQGMMQPQMGQPQMPQDPRQMAAYGGIMGVDGRKNYGWGSFYQKYIKDPIERGVTGKTAEKQEEESQARVDREDELYGEGYESKWDTMFKGEEQPKIDPATGDPMKNSKGEVIYERSRNSIGSKFFDPSVALPVLGGAIAGLFSDKLNPPDAEGNIDYGSGIGIQNVGKVANLLDVQQGQNAGLRFLPEVSARKYSPAQMAEAYASTDTLPIATANLAGGGIAELGVPDYGQQMMDPNMMEQIKMMVESMQAQGMGKEEMEQAVRMQVPNMSADMSMGYAEGGPLGEMGTVMEEGEEMLDMNGMEKDYREEGGFVPIGEYEKKDDVPARLSVNEFVFTADAVRGAGDGDIDKGAERLQGIMKQLEQQGRPEGMGMLDVSERLSEVV
jgi:hypothetical protein